MKSPLSRFTAAIAVVMVSSVSCASPSAPPDLSAATLDIAPLPPLPDWSPLPDDAADYMESLSSPSKIRPASDRRFATVAAHTSVGDIPAAALAAYQRAESIIGVADARCHLSWQLVAAIGRVESDHGRSTGSSASPRGVSRPAIIGPALDGADGTARVRDTDGGELDGDQDFDHAVGPMQLLPSIWAVAGVDADGDGTRNPQDVDDAALAVAVYLCSGTDNLRTPAGLRAAMLTYNDSDAYVESVLSIMEDYLAGDEMTTPSGSSVSAGIIVPLVPLVPLETTTTTTNNDEQHGTGQQDSSPSRGPGASHGGPATHGVRGHTGGEPAWFIDYQPPKPPKDPKPPKPPKEPQPPVEPEPTDEPTDIPTDIPTPEPTDEPTDIPTDEPTDIPTDEPTDEPSDIPTDVPTDEPSDIPTDVPTDEPSDIPSDGPTDVPSIATDRPVVRSADRPAGRSAERSTGKPGGKSGGKSGPSDEVIEACNLAGYLDDLANPADDYDVCVEAHD